MTDSKSRTYAKKFIAQPPLREFEFGENEGEKCSPKMEVKIIDRGQLVIESLLDDPMLGL